ncbi:MAG TPA: DUF1588 domain-containing protein [Polyangiaceae bacterium]|nr:DUF1588 domain-containing protein [Polyangiaceae bacterium]
MRPVSLRFTRRTVELPLIFAVLGLGCTGTIDEAPTKARDRAATGSGGNASTGAGGNASTGAGGNGTGTTGSGGGSTGGNGAGGSAPGDGGVVTTPTLAEIAAQYFPGQTATNPLKRVFRLTRTQLDITTKTLLPQHVTTTAVASVPRDPLQTNYEYADNLSFNPANFTPYTNWVTQIATAVKAAPTSVIDCTASANSPACLTDQAKKFVSKAFRGTAPDAALARYTDFFTASVATYGAPSATSELVDLTLTSPSYVFRDEVLTDTASLLLPAQQLQNITYTLADAPPETVGLSSATPTSYLSTPALVQKTVDQVLASAEARAKLLRFFVAWLEVKEPDEFTIAASVFPEFTPEVAAAVVTETKTFLERQLSTLAPKMKDVTESTQSFVSSAGAFLYGKMPPTTAAFMELDPTQRLGIFTQPGVLASHSGPTTTRLVKRGVFFTRKVMCLPLGQPPPDVDLTVPTTAGATERQRIETATTQPRCAACHGFINPFGFMQENFDAIGRWRTLDEGKPVDPSITVGFLDEGKLTVSSPVEALKAFTRSLRFQQCFARQLFRFYTGREEATGDDPLLRQMFFDFANNGKQDIVGMLHTLAGSSAFSRRSEAP